MPLFRAVTGNEDAYGEPAEEMGVLRELERGPLSGLSRDRLTYNIHQRDCRSSNENSYVGVSVLIVFRFVLLESVRWVGSFHQEFKNLSIY
jgi:hypothetical protein